MLFKLIIAKVIMEDFMVHRDIVLVSYLFVIIVGHWVFWVEHFFLHIYWNLFQVTLKTVYRENLSSVKINRGK